MNTNENTNENTSRRKLSKRGRRRDRETLILLAALGIDRNTPFDWIGDWFFVLDTARENLDRAYTLGLTFEETVRVTAECLRPWSTLNQEQPN